MMRTVALLMVAGALAAGCGDGGTPNPPQVWVAPLVDELHVQLVAQEPHPY